MPRMLLLGRILFLLSALAALPGCAGLVVTGKIVTTPFTLARDVVDAPLVATTNVFEFFADESRLAKAPHAGAGWSLKGGFNLNIGYDFSWLLFKSLSGLFGCVDYLVCRSIWPNFPAGVNPWKQKGQSWGSLFFPNTRVLWGDESPIFRAEDKPPPE
ncbi:hypothetical protein HZA57_02985 [Candidatus Poribacteria bacterium]|nr:hypothetical protein [Candidatus Poribacteria bacterium]